MTLLSFAALLDALRGVLLSIEEVPLQSKKRNTILICNMLKDENVIARVIMITEITYSARSSYSKIHSTDKYSQHNSVIWSVWLNG